MAVLPSSGLPFFLIGSRKVLFTFFLLPFTWTFLVMNLNV